MKKKDLTMKAFNKIYDSYMEVFRKRKIDEQKFTNDLMQFLDDVDDADEDRKCEIIKKIKTAVMNEQLKRFNDNN